MFTSTQLHPLPKRLLPSTGAGIGRALVTAWNAGDTDTQRVVTEQFTIEQCISSLWEMTVWVTGHTRIHGNPERAVEIMRRATEHATDNPWTHDFLDATDDALRADHAHSGPGNKRLNRPNTNRAIYHSYTAVQTRPGELGWPHRVIIGVGGQRGTFASVVTDTEPGLIEGATEAAALVAEGCADLERVPVELLLSVVNASTYVRALRGDYDR
jgi:hypothetical protein